MFRFLYLIALFSLATGFTVAPTLRGASRQSTVRMAAAPLRTNDVVKVISGDDKGTVGKVLMVDTVKGKVVVEGVNIMTKHVKPMKEGERGSILKKERPIHISKVKVTDEAAPTVDAEAA